MALSTRKRSGRAVEFDISHGSSNDLWKHAREVTQDITANLKDAVKSLQDENTGVTGPPFLQATESQRKLAIKRALNRLGRALNQVSTIESYSAGMKEEMKSLQKKLEASEKAYKEMEGSTAKMQEQIEGSQSKMKDTLNRLNHEEELMTTMLKELEAARLAADLARKEKFDVLEELRLRDSEKGKHTEELVRLATREKSLRAENEKLGKQFMSALKEKEMIEVTLKAAANATANVERYKEVVAKVTADNMVFLMKLKHSELALTSAQGRLSEMQKEIETCRGRWLEEASGEIQEIVLSSLNKAEDCESRLQLLQSQQDRHAQEWEEKLKATTEKLFQVTSSRDWFERNLMEATDRFKASEDENLRLVQTLESECGYRQQAEAESRALISTLRETNDELAHVKSELAAAIKDVEAHKRLFSEKDEEMDKVRADLDQAKGELQTQLAVNGALMKKKEAVEWELMAAEAQRAKLHESLQERLQKSYARSTPMSQMV